MNLSTIHCTMLSPKPQSLCYYQLSIRAPQQHSPCASLRCSTPIKSQHPTSCPVICISKRVQHVWAICNTILQCSKCGMDKLSTSASVEQTSKALLGAYHGLSPLAQLIAYYCRSTTYALNLIFDSRSTTTYTSTAVDKMT